VIWFVFRAVGVSDVMLLVLLVLNYLPRGKKVRYG
jgi:hypothetical protein